MDVLVLPRLQKMLLVCFLEYGVTSQAFGTDE